ncbi:MULTISPECIES: gliding motility-associated C-terminal domain-containing protein [unclassified Myroides]|uniref:gliding motility-associated C-terminal domain-containing protein n=1 Tax=unclassified Myroides TaxID=2642485 RepID=UPI0015F90C29|nr:MULTISPECIES: gliding motility-associated C-terminal domain-containing protein [unclassified Myroides]MBB1149409.1 gliding motility-associated C-terminal domain-containing protein [Myroides sp. NP-2]MDM1406688.1 gliding motility-associated C-terminal domain-containing protein [Myroides sp. DF42-4-2]
MNKKIIFTAVAFCCISITTYSQEPSLTSNEGVLSVSSGDLVSFEGTFENQESGDVTNDGTVIYFQHFLNDGLYGITENHKTSTTIFTVDGRPNGIKQLLGDGIASFYNVQFDNPIQQVAFDLKQNIDIYGTADFQSGIIKVDPEKNAVTGVSHGMITFQNGSTTLNVRDEAHVDGVIEKIGNESFTYPSGDQGKYRYARISAPKGSKDAFTGAYTYDDPAFFESRPNKVGVINTLNTKEYWLIDKGENNTSDVLLTLSWNETTTSPEVLKTPEANLHIVRWDDKAQLWVDEGGVVDMSTKEVTTIATVKGYGFFTLATVKEDWVLDGDIVIYNLVTPDGDGKNDYFIIDNIKNYPNNKVEIFNRWGSRVYETRGYDPNGDGSSNVFRGYSEGKATIDKGSKLPSGTYYYVITYEYTDDNGSRMIKKAANLHLENN